MKKKLLIGAFIVIAAFITACDNNGTTPPTCQEACIETQANHLGRNDNGTLAACGHNGKTIQGACECTEQTTTLSETTIPVTKNASVSVVQMTVTVATVSGAYKGWTTTQKQKFAEKVTEIRITSGSDVSFANGIFKVGYSAEAWQIFDGADDNDLFV